jgi:superfamily II DNA helicase RecQ
MSYEDKIKSLKSPSFDEIRDIAINEVSHLSESERKQLWRELTRGTALLNTHNHLCQYLFSFGNMHKAKLIDAFTNLPSETFDKEIEIIDWGCGQGIGTILLFDFIRNKGITNRIRKITLIEPSKEALNRANLHLQPFINGDISLVQISSFFETISSEVLNGNSDRNVIHIFSNILDVVEIDLKSLANLVDSNVNSDNYLVCVGPLNPTNKRIDAFYRYFDERLISNIYEYENSNFLNRGWTYKARIYRLEPNKNGHLIPIKYYPSVQFVSAYELDSVRKERFDHGIDFYKDFVQFEVSAPFDLGASVYDDVHPVLAVLNNIICRGIPTKSSCYVEDKFHSIYGFTSPKVEYGEINYSKKVNRKFLESEKELKNIILNKTYLTEEQKIDFEFLLTPIAIARFQKVLIEAIITDQLPINEQDWKILVDEKDVPFAHIAIEDFKNLFNNLVSLTSDYQNFQLPEIDLYVINQSQFKNSKLHFGKIHTNTNSNLLNTNFDMVLTLSMLNSEEYNIESFSEFKVKNNCYFNVQSTSNKRINRVIYTSNLIKYENLVQKNNVGIYQENEKQKSHLTYFLKLFFRKESFRPGQLPILDRALQNLPVIGLLPTGGGKSLTYQISALLQPGVTMIIDPLKSLMKDQFDGLVNNGIDCAAYINSTLSSSEKKIKEKQLESSELLFVFLSPERLSIASFRERLKNMHDYNVYFSYGVIDEVHCVSEWGHDFRFSYLHLGRNLYNYVRAKENEISLFGLTATASFDVLADVERELSGNGAFVLDSDVIVRYENTNRFELQFKIESVEVDFEVDTFYDQRNLIDPSLPKAINITNHWPLYDSKSNYLKSLITDIPKYLKELQTTSSLKQIKERFIERQNNEEGTEINLNTKISDRYFENQTQYQEAGIIFCPHVESTGISVKKNSRMFLDYGIQDVSSFSGRDDDNISMKSLELFRENKSPLMVATKAFGMGIDKPNVRFTVNLNYSSSLESFVQESGRAGRDKKIALSTILISDYSLVQISKTYLSKEFPISILRNKWFKENDFKEITKFYNLDIPNEFLLYANPGNDIVKLHCSKDNIMFAFNRCSQDCSEFNRCSLKKVNSETKGWRSEMELVNELKVQNLNISKKNFQYLNADYQTVMFFFNEAFKGDIIEKKYMNQLLNTSTVYIGYTNERIDAKPTRGFLTSVLSSAINTEIIVFIPYNEEESTDLSKAIYRMTCIELIEDFTQDYSKKEFRVVTRLKPSGEYYNGLNRFLQRYYTEDRAKLEITKVKELKIKVENVTEIETEIYQCLAYLTEFVYDKISEKRKRAIDDMRNFCIEGLDSQYNWLERNENLKDYIFYYFNSKYAKSDYIADNGEPFSLVEDTEGGKRSDFLILKKYLRVIDDEIVGVGTPLDNIKHLYGAVRLISRSLTDSNPSLYLMESFCLAYMGFKKNKNLENQFLMKYSEGMIEFSKRYSKQKEFWEVFDFFNHKLENYIPKKTLDIIIEETHFLIHSSNFNHIKNQYLETYE